MDDYGDCLGAAHDTRSWVKISRDVNVAGATANASILQFLLLWTCTAEVCVVSDMVVNHGNRAHLLPMVLMGIFSYLQSHSRQIHRRPYQLRLPKCSCTAIRRIAQDS